MRRSLVTILGMLALGAAVFAGSYFIGHRVGFACCARSVDDLSWLRSEFHLSAAEMSRIRQLHEGYLPQCTKMCSLIAAKNAELEASLGPGTNLTSETREKLSELGQLRTQCQAQMLQHFVAVSQAMPPAEGRRYLAEMEKVTLGSHEEIEQTMSAGHEHGTH